MGYLTLFISLKCTNACAHCLYGCSPKTGQHMSWDVFTKSVSIAEENRIASLNFFGGEPFLNPKFFLMLETALVKGFSLILATNCRPLSKENVFAKFLDITESYKERIVVITARDRFHLQFFDPTEVIQLLQSQDYEVLINDYSNNTVLLSEHNLNNQELRKLNTTFSCCGGNWKDYLGVLPDGGWAVCPVSLETFGNIFINSLEEIIEFKSQIPLRYKEGCTECLKDFKDFQKEFEAIYTAKERRI